MPEMQFNDGHRNELRKLGLLGDEENAINAEELVSRAKTDAQLSEAMGFIGRELTAQVMKLQLVEALLAQIERELERFADEELPAIEHQYQETQQIFDEVQQNAIALEAGLVLLDRAWSAGQDQVEVPLSVMEDRQKAALDSDTLQKTTGALSRRLNQVQKTLQMQD